MAKRDFTHLFTHSALSDLLLYSKLQNLQWKASHWTESDNVIRRFLFFEMKQTNMAIVAFDNKWKRPEYCEVQLQSSIIDKRFIIHIFCCSFLLLINIILSTSTRYSAIICLPISFGPFWWHHDNKPYSKQTEFFFYCSPNELKCMQDIVKTIPSSK